MRGAKAVLDTLRAFDTEYVFGVPGSSFPIYAEFAGRNDIKPILTRDERGAACMATPGRAESLPPTGDRSTIPACITHRSGSLT